MITSGVIITLIICATLIIISIISAIGKAAERKRVQQDLKPFKDAFPNFERRNQGNENNDYFKKF